MGCFDYTCAISGLPIRAGDDVRWLILTENPYNDNGKVAIHDFAFPRTWPVRAKYDDYGSIDSYDKTGPAVVGVVAGFNEDLVEVGTADNTCHDVPTSRGMPFEHVLTAVIEDRIFVKRERWRSDSTSEPPAELPTLQRIRELLRTNGFEVESGKPLDKDKPASSCYLVDEISHGWVRVRPSGYSSRLDLLQVILPILQRDYAAMITANSEGSHGPEIQVMPLPNSNHICISLKQDAEEKPLENYQMFIHGKVWDSIVAKGRFGKIRAEVQREWDTIVKLTQSEETLERLAKLMPDLPPLRIRNLGRTGYLGFSSIPFTMGPGEHTHLIATHHVNNPFSEQQIKDFLDDVAGFACVNRYLHGINYWWRPSWYAGQSNTYREHLGWHTKLMKICQEIRENMDKEWRDSIDTMNDDARTRDEANDDQG